jgi:hypothetical protein
MNDRFLQAHPLNGKWQSAPRHLACNRPHFDSPCHFFGNLPSSFAAAVPLHGIYSIDDWETAIPKKNCNEATQSLEICSPLAVLRYRPLQEAQRSRRLSTGQS